MNIIDIIIVAILALGLVAGMHKGFLASTLALVGFVGSWFASLRLYQYLAGAVNSNTLITASLGSVLSELDLIQTKSLAATAVSAVTDTQLTTAVGEIGVPIIRDMFKSHVLSKSFADLGITTLSDYLTQTFVAAAINVAAFVVTFAVVYFAVLLVVNLLNNVFRFPQLRHLDWLLGGVFGVVRGAAVVYLIFALMPVATQVLAGINVPLFTDLIDQSKLAGLFMNGNILTSALANLMG